MKIRKFLSAALICIVMTVSAAYASDIGDILKNGAIIVGGGYVISAIAKPLNDFINTITFNKGVKYDGYTKVVPIVSFGNGTRLGAAQVGSTNKNSLDQTKAVGQINGQWKSIEARALIPINSTNPLKGVKRVSGVGVTAIIDVQL